MPLRGTAQLAHSAAATTNHISQPEIQAIPGTGRLGPQAEEVGESSVVVANCAT
jgi:hypothetical protein